MDKQKQVTDEFLQELKAFIRESRKVPLSNGKVLEIKPLSWKKELQIINLIGKAFNEGLSFQQFSELNQNSYTLSSINLFLTTLLQIAPDILTEIVVIITELDREIIENEMVLDDLIEIATPFLGNILIRLKINLEKKIIPLLQNVLQTK